MIHAHRSMKNAPVVVMPWESDICPVTGLPVTRKPEWTNRTFSDVNYRISFSVIGTNIIYSKVWGYSHINSCLDYLALLEKVADGVCGIDGKFILIEDYTHHQGASLRARNQYSNYQKKNPRLAGLIFCTESALFKIMIKMGKSLFLPGFPVAIVDKYEDAIRWAVDVQRKTDTPAARNKTGRVHEIKELADAFLNFRKTGQGALPDTQDASISADRNILSENQQTPPAYSSGWTIKLDGISCRYNLIGDDILLYAATGELKEHHVEKLFECYETAVMESGLNTKGYLYQIADWRHLGKSSLQARKLYIERFRKSSRKYPCKLYVVFGLSRFLETVLRLSGQFFPVPISVARDLNDAVAIINRHRIKTLEPDADTSKKRPNFPEEDTRRTIEKLLNFIGGINWGVPASATKENHVSDSHPFKPLFEAISLIKEDFEILLREKILAERIIAEQNKFNLLRAKIWLTWQ
jgi:hypothetical protein